MADLQVVGWCLFDRNGRHCGWQSLVTIDPATWADKDGEGELGRLAEAYPSEAPFSYQPVYRKVPDGVGASGQQTFSPNHQGVER